MDPSTPTKLQPSPKVIVTPVAAARAHFKKQEPAQTTITQWERDTKKETKTPPSSPSSESSSEDSEFEKKKKPPKKRRAHTNRKKPTTTTTTKKSKKDQNKNPIANTLIKVDNTVNLKKCHTIEDRDWMTKAGKHDNTDKDTESRKAKEVKPKKNKKTTKNKDEKTDKVTPSRNQFNVGDLVMSTAKQIGHPAYEFKYVSPSYLFFGSVKDIVMGKDPADDKINVHWMTIEKGAVRFADVQTVMIPYDPRNSYDDHYVAMAPTRMEDLKVLARHTSNDLSLVNDFVSATVNDQFEFHVSGGWIKKV
jgi:hypothetical protein